MERDLNDLALRKRSLKLRLAAQAEKLVGHIEGLDAPKTPLEAERMAKALKAADAAIAQIFKDDEDETPDDTEEEDMNDDNQTLTLDIDPLRLLELETGDGVAFGSANYRLSHVDQGEIPTVTFEPAPEVRAFVSADPSAAGSVSTVVAGSVMTGLRLLELPCLPLETIASRTHLCCGGMFYSGK